MPLTPIAIWKLSDSMITVLNCLRSAHPYPITVAFGHYGTIKALWRRRLIKRKGRHWTLTAKAIRGLQLG